MKSLILIPAILILGACRSEDNGRYAVSWEYMELEQAYDRCLGYLPDERSVEAFEKRLACTQAVYGGD